MRKIFYPLFVLFATCMLSCSEEYDDTDIRNDMADLESRVQALEELCNTMNTNIASLQTLVSALQQNDYITAITPVTSGSEEVGYTITFLNHAPITIYHGKDGTDGKDGADGVDGVSPQLKVENGFWQVSYDNGTTWTQLAEALYAPQLKIENDYWYVSYDNGTTWNMLGKATGEDGQTGPAGATGVTPQLKIVDGNWYVSYDGGATWSRAGRATGDNGLAPQLKIEDGYWQISYDGGSTWEKLELAATGTGSGIPQLKIEDGYWYVSYNNGTSWMRLGKATGEEGAAGQVGATGNTPQLKIEGGYWYVSYDKGNQWELLGKATGEDGATGAAPQIGVRQDSDGIYYWTLDGTWLLDDAGQKVRAQGADGEEGAAGITPQLKIEDGYWWVSYGGEWIELGNAGEGSADSMFEGIDTSNEEYVVFTLANGSTLTIPKYQGLDIKFGVDVSDDIGLVPGVTVEIPYKVTGISIYARIKVLTFDEGLHAYIVGSVREGTLSISCEDDTQLNNALVLLTVIDNSKTKVAGLTFSNGALSTLGDVIRYVEPEGGTVEFSLYNNLQYNYSIDNGGTDWITPLADTRAHYDYLQFAVCENTGEARYTTITFSDLNDKIHEQVVIAQGGAAENDFLQVNGKQVFIDLDKVSNHIDLSVAIKKADKLGATEYVLKGDFTGLKFSSDGDKVYNPLQNASLAEVIDLSLVTGWPQVKAEESQSDGLVGIPDGMFSPSGYVGGGSMMFFQKLQKVILPAEIQVIGNAAFNYCKDLEDINLENIVKIGDSAFNGCKSLSNLNAPQLVYVGEISFWYSGITEINCPNLVEVGISAFSQNPLEYVYLPNLQKLGGGSFSYCSNLSTVILPNAIDFDLSPFDRSSVRILKLTASEDFVDRQFVMSASWDTTQCDLYLNENKRSEVTNDNEWRQLTWKSITFVNE